MLEFNGIFNANISPDDIEFLLNQFIDTTDISTLPLTQFLFFDIETTGLSSKSSLCYLIGCVFFRDGSWQFKQFFSELPDNEATIINAFQSFASDFEYIIHFNGDAFDLRFIKERCRMLGIEYTFSRLKSIDLYKSIKALAKLLKLDNYKQKNIEVFLGLNLIRNDKESGKDLIRIYKDYVTKSLLHEECDDKLKLLLLHNHDDICMLPELCQILSYNTAINAAVYDDITYNFPENFQKVSHNYNNDNDNYLQMQINLKYSFPKEITIKDDFFIISFNENTITVSAHIFNGTLKYFYPNYKDYYYLINENIVVHKSLAGFVDKNARIKATADNCYTSKTDYFIAQPFSLLTPAFKKEHNSYPEYVQLNESLFENKTALSDYAKSIVKKLCN